MKRKIHPYRARRSRKKKNRNRSKGATNATRARTEAEIQIPTYIGESVTSRKKIRISDVYSDSDD